MNNPPVACLYKLLNEAETQANDCYWEGDNVTGDRHTKIALSYRKRILDGETVDVNF